MDVAPQSNPSQGALVTPAAPRFHYIDNLRWVLVILVISMHAADTYSPLGNWYFVDRTPLSTPVLLFFAAWQMFLQAFFMGLLFFIAGLFVPQSFDRKGPMAFARDRARRLGVPVLFYMFVLGPVTEYYLAHSWTSTKPTSFAHEWLGHIRNGEFRQENGPLWFCVALLIFSLTYAVLRAPEPLRAPGPRTARPPPSTAALICFALAMAAATFLVRAVRPPTVLNMHLGDFSQYILLFAAGVLAARQQWVSELPVRPAIAWLVLVSTAGSVGWLALVLGGGGLSGSAEFYSGGWHWQSAALSLWESATCVGMCFGLLVFFREKINLHGRISTFASDNAFGVYVIHPPVVIAIARLLYGVPWHPLLKFVILAGSATAVSFVLSAMLAAALRYNSRSDKIAD
jgi:glucans biosynthesis protein C